MMRKFPAVPGIVLLLAFCSVAAFAQFRNHGIVAVCDVACESDFWRAELPVFLGDALADRLRMESSLFVQDRAETGRLVKEGGQEINYDSDIMTLCRPFNTTNVSGIIAAKLVSMVQTRDVDGSSQVRSEFAIRIIDAFQQTLIREDRFTVTVRLVKALAEDQPFDPGIARTLFNGALSRLQLDVRQAYGDDEFRIH